MFPGVCGAGLFCQTTNRPVDHQPSAPCFFPLHCNLFGGLDFGDGWGALGDDWVRRSRHDAAETAHFDLGRTVLAAKAISRGGVLSARPSNAMTSLAERARQPKIKYI